MILREQQYDTGKELRKSSLDNRKKLVFWARYTMRSWVLGNGLCGTDAKDAD